MKEINVALMCSRINIENTWLRPCDSTSSYPTPVKFVGPRQCCVILHPVLAQITDIQTSRKTVTETLFSKGKTVSGPCAARSGTSDFRNASPAMPDQRSAVAPHNSINGYHIIFNSASNSSRD